MDEKLVSLTFPLLIEENWPPVSVECLPFLVSDEGFRVQAPPVFIKGISVGDLLNITVGLENVVESWCHVHRSGRTTIWLGGLKETSEISAALAKLRGFGCNTVTVDTVGCYSIDVPETISISAVDMVLDALDSDSVAVAFPSMRHVE